MHDDIIRSVNLSDALLTARTTQILLQRAHDENETRGLVDSAVASVIFGAGFVAGPRLDDRCQCETAKKGIASTEVGLLKGPGESWQWPVSLETDRPCKVLGKLQEWKIEVEASNTQCPCDIQDQREMWWTHAVRAAVPTCLFGFKMRSARGRRNCRIALVSSSMASTATASTISTPTPTTKSEIVRPRAGVKLLRCLSLRGDSQDLDANLSLPRGI